MKKSTIKAFTLVEMLIVIVIIGILIASLMPRMQSAQWRARDVARKNDLAQIQTAIITSQQDRGMWPGMNSGATSWTWVSVIKNDLTTAGMTQVPWDPNQANEVYWLWSVWSTNAAVWEYIYLVTTRNSVPNAWFALMAKTEVEWWSNWVTCMNGTDLSGWVIKAWDDLANVKTCTSFTKVADQANCKINWWTCQYYDISELRYLLVY